MSGDAFSVDLETSNFKIFSGKRNQGALAWGGGQTKNYWGSNILRIIIFLNIASRNSSFSKLSKFRLLREKCQEMRSPAI